MTIYEQKRIYTKQLIINSFIQLSNCNGINSVNITDIYKHAKISRSTFYRYFDSKQDLIDYIEFLILDKINQKIQKHKYNYYCNLEKMDLEYEKIIHADQNVWMQYNSTKNLTTDCQKNTMLSE